MLLMVGFSGTAGKVICLWLFCLFFFHGLSYGSHGLSGKKMFCCRSHKWMGAHQCVLSCVVSERFLVSPCKGKWYMEIWLRCVLHQHVSVVIFLFWNAFHKQCNEMPLLWGKDSHELFLCVCQENVRNRMKRCRYHTCVFVVCEHFGESGKY